MHKFAIIGCGRIAARHAEHINNVGRLIAVCDIIPSKAEALADQYGANPYDSIDNLLQHEKELDVICICSPNGLHAEHAIKSLQHGMHVLCEKPLCLTSVAGWQLVETAYRFDRKLFVVKQNRYNPGVKLLKNLILQNKLGQLYSFQVNCFWNRPQEYYTGDWKGTLDLDGGILYTQFSHFIDVLYWLLGDVKEVKAYKQNYSGRQHFNIEDSGVAILQLQNNMIGTLNYTINAHAKNREGSITIFGERGTVKIGGQYLNKVEYFSVEGETAPQLPGDTSANQYGFYEGSMSNHHLVYEHLIKALNNKENEMVEAAEAVKTIEIIEKIYKAAQSL